jgi:hypothetical protein
MTPQEATQKNKNQLYNLVKTQDIAKAVFSRAGAPPLLPA